MSSSNTRVTCVGASDTELDTSGDDHDNDAWALAGAVTNKDAASASSAAKTIFFTREL